MTQQSTHIRQPLRCTGRNLLSILRSLWTHRLLSGSTVWNLHPTSFLMTDVKESSANWSKFQISDMQQSNRRVPGMREGERMLVPVAWYLTWELETVIVRRRLNRATSSTGQGSRMRACQLITTRETTHRCLPCRQAALTLHPHIKTQASPTN